MERAAPLSALTGLWPATTLRDTSKTNVVPADPVSEHGRAPASSALGPGFRRDDAQYWGSGT